MFFPPLSQKVLLRNLSVQDATFQYRLQPLSQCNGASEISGSQLGILDVAKYWGDLSIWFRKSCQCTPVAFTINKHKTGFLGVPAFLGIQLVPTFSELSDVNSKLNSKNSKYSLPCYWGVNQKWGIYVRNKEAERAAGGLKPRCWLGACGEFLGF